VQNIKIHLAKIVNNTLAYPFVVVVVVVVHYCCVFNGCFSHSKRNRHDRNRETEQAQQPVEGAYACIAMVDDVTVIQADQSPGQGWCMGSTVADKLSQFSSECVTTGSQG